MKRTNTIGAVLMAVGLLAAGSPQQAQAAAASGIDRLYVLDCGWAHAADQARWSPGVNVGVPLDVSDNCYLIHNVTGGYFLWDTGIAESVAAMPDGLSQNNGTLVWHRPKTLASQLASVGVKPEDIKLLAISHMHGDHSGNVDMFPNGKLLIQKAEWDAIFAAPNPPFKADHPAEQITGDKDVFGDGSATILSTPGHTPGHQSLLVHLNKTGWVVLSGDATHFKANWDAKRVPAGNTDKEKTVTSMQRISDILAEHKAQLWINHDKPQSDALKHAPAFYD